MTQTAAPPARAGLFVDGQERPAASGATFEVFNPATGGVIGAAAQGAEADVEASVAAARRAFEESPWRRMAPAQRAPVLRKIAELIRRDAEALAQLEASN